MASEFHCPDCGTVLPEKWAEAGECPVCLMGLATSDADEPEAPAGTSPVVGSKIGPYTILRSLGEGGMGEVFLAEQAEPIRRRVALKVIKQGMHTPRVISRFESERQALALMDHPGIARVFDAGSTPEGRPYFVMEYVDGDSITAHCDRLRLSLSERLDLFMKVCAAVQHAHQKGVIHRDLKPSNILVTTQDGEAVPKVIDFGIAKATAREPAEHATLTDLGTIIGTMEYMSPEQAEFSALELDTRTDVYSLGVILYELLTGALPFDSEQLRAAAVDEARRVIRSEEPSRPSARLETLGDRATESARCRKIPLPALKRELSGDLDWITLKTLEKEPSRRYGSPAELAADIRRHLMQEPIEARPASAVYRFRKFVRRNRLLVASATTVLVALLVGVAGVTVFGLREAAQRKRAEQASADLEEVVGFQQRMLSDIDVAKMGDRLVERLQDRLGEARGHELERLLVELNTTDAALELLDEEILARAVKAIDEHFTDQPLVEARLRRSIGSTYSDLGMYDKAAEQLERAIEIYREHGGLDERRRIGALRGLGLALWRRGRYEEAERTWNETLELSRQVLGDTDSDTIDALGNLGVLYYRTGRLEEAARVQEEVLAKRKSTEPDSTRLYKAMGDLADTYSSMVRYEEAEALYRQALAGLKRTQEEESEDLLAVMANLAGSLHSEGRLDEAKEGYDQALTLARRLFGTGHPHTVGLGMNLASIHMARGEHARAEALYRGLLSGLEEQGLSDSHVGLNLRLTLGISLSGQNRHAEAAKQLVSTLADQRRVLGRAHQLTMVTLLELDKVLWNSGRHDEGRETASELLAIMREDASGLRDPFYQYFLAYRILAWDEDLRDPELAHRIAVQANELTDYSNADFLDVLARACFAIGDTDGAVEHQRKAVSLIPPGHPLLPEFEGRLATYEEAQDTGAVPEPGSVPAS